MSAAIVYKTFDWEESNCKQCSKNTVQESKLKAVYYGLQEVYGKSSEAKSGTKWKKAEWEEFKAKFQETFGIVEQPKYTVEQMIQFSINRFNKGLPELLEVKRKTCQRREKYFANQAEVI